MRALVVDDDAMNRELLRRMLVRLGWTVEDARDGRSAVAACGLERFDLVLVDLLMPGLDGMATAEAILTAAAAAHGPRPCLMAVTGSERRYDHDAVFDGFLAKPFILSELATSIEAAMTDRDRRTLPGT